MAKVRLDISADEARAFKAFQRLIAKEKELGRAADKVTSKTRKTEKGMLTAFGPSMQGQLAAMVTKAGAVTAVLGTVLKTLRSINAERERGAKLLAEHEAPEAKLLQLAGGDAAKYKTLRSQVKASRLQAGMSTEEASNLVFTLHSLGLGQGGHRAFFQGFKGITDPAALAEGAATMRAAFTPAEAGSVRSMANKLFTASGISKTKLEAFAPAATVGAQQARAIGMSDEEFLGAMAVLTRATKSPETAATQLGALSDVAFRKGLGGKGLLAALPDIRRAVEKLSPEKQVAWFGNVEARRGFGALTGNLAEVQSAVGEVEAAGLAPRATDLAARTFRLRREDPRLAGMLDARRAREARAVREEEAGEEQLRRQAERDKRIARTESSLGRFIYRDVLAPVEDYSATLSGAAPAAARLLGMADLSGVSARLERAAQKLERGAGSMERTAGGQATQAARTIQVED